MSNGRRRLPDETLPRITALVKQSAPNPNRPRLSDETELRLDPIERDSASCYAAIEDTSDKFRKLAEVIMGKPEEDEEVTKEVPPQPAPQPETPGNEAPADDSGKPDETAPAQEPHKPDDN